MIALASFSRSRDPPRWRILRLISFLATTRHAIYLRYTDDDTSKKNSTLKSLTYGIILLKPSRLVLSSDQMNLSVHTELQWRCLTWGVYRSKKLIPIEAQLLRPFPSEEKES